MTVTQPAAGARPPRRRWTRRLAATGLAALLALAPALPAAGSPTTPSPSPTATEDLTGEARLTVSPMGNGVVPAGQPLTATARIDNGTGRSLAATRVALLLGDAPLPDRAALTSWLDGAREGVALAEVDAASLGSVESGADESAVLAVPADDPRLAGRAPGVYPLLAVADLAGQQLFSASAIVIPGETATPTPVGVVVPLTAPPLTRGLLTSDQLTELTAADGTLTAQLNAVEGTSAILAIDPAIPAAIRALGSAAPELARTWLSRLEALPNPRFALQFGDADLAPQLHAGLAEPLQPTSLQAYLSAGDFLPTAARREQPGAAPAGTPTATPTPTPTATADPGEPQYPDLRQLLEVGTASHTVYWPATGTADASIVAALGSLPGAPGVAMVDSASTEAGAGGGTVPARADAAGSPVLVYDTLVSAALADAAAQAEATQRGALLAAATAHLVFAHEDVGGRPLLVAVDRAENRTFGSLRAALTAVLQTPGTTSASLTDLVSAEPVPVAVTAPASDDRVEATRSLMQGEAEIARFSAILDDPSLLTGRERAEVLQLLGVGWREDAEAAGEAVLAHRAETERTLDAVGILPSTLVRLISYDAALRPWVRNDLPWPVNVELTAQPNDVRLVVADRTTVRGQPDSNTRVEVPVQARLANGEVAVALQLFSPTGEPIGAPQTVDVEVRAEWENIGLGVLVALFVLFIGTGVVRMVRRRRRAPATPAEGETPS